MGIVATKGFQYRGAPKELIEHLRKRHTFDTFIETGTHIGATAYWASTVFRNVVTFEAATEVYGNLDKTTPNIKFILGDSAELLGGHLVDRSIIYLDAHYSAGITHKSYPLLKELEHINRNGSPNLVIIVDDARFCTSIWNDESYGDPAEIMALLSNSKGRHVCIFDDMLIAVPWALENDLRDHINAKSKVYWERFQSENGGVGVRGTLSKIKARLLGS